MRYWRPLTLLFILTLCGAAASASQEALSQPALFGSREVFSPDSSAFFKWHDVLDRFAGERREAAAACASGAVERCEPAEWGALVGALKGLDLRAKLDRVNAEINRHPYIPSRVNWHESNHWETPFEFLSKGGQCQDYAIAKYLLLRAAGVPDSSLRVVVLRDTQLGLDHAVTVAYVEGEALVLDNQEREVVPASRLDHYRPYYSINEQGWWLHRVQGAQYAAIN
jgi:predicted transglutaminase-like cysteine proteinase